MNFRDYEKLRTVIMRPYRRGQGPAFSLTIWDTGRNTSGATGRKVILAYRFRAGGRVIFEGEDFACSPLHAIDSDATIASLLSFLTLRPGDTDPEYFRDYTPAQLLFCEEHAEALSAEVLSRFGER